MGDRHPDAGKIAGRPEPTLEDYLFLFFGPSDASRAAGREFWSRRHQRTVDVDPPSPAQELIVYPDSGHGSLFQYPSLFVGHVSGFLAAEPPFA
jgi:hypothetical protein